MKMIRLYSIQACYMALFHVGFFVLHLQKGLGFNLKQIILLQSILGFSQFLSEIPTGLFADRFLKKYSIAVGMSLISLSWIGFVQSHNFLEISLSFFVQGIGHSFVSGADRALLYQSIASNHQKAFSLFAITGQMSELVFSVLGAFIYQSHTQAPFYLMAFLNAVGVLFACSLKEERIPIKQKQYKKGQLFQLKAFLGKASSRYTQLLPHFIICSLASYLCIWFMQPLAELHGMHGLQIYWSMALSNLFVVLGNKSLHASPKLSGVYWILQIALLLFTIQFGLLSLDLGIFTFLPYFVICFIRGFIQPLISLEECKEVPGDQLATFLSFRSFLIRCFFLPSGVAIAWIADKWQADKAMLTLFFLGLLSLFLLAVRRAAGQHQSRSFILAFLRQGKYKEKVP